MKIARILIIAACIAGLVWGLCRERHEVYSLTGETLIPADGAKITEYATFDGLMLKGKRIYDIFTLGGMTAREKGGKIVTAAESPKAGASKDCKT
jgi:hypothetical protein